jgi:hypothetical protein
MDDKMTEYSRRMGVAIAGLLGAALLLTACSTEIDREFGPSALQGDGELPGRVITLSPPTGV